MKTVYDYINKYDCVEIVLLHALSGKRQTFTKEELNGYNCITDELVGAVQYSEDTKSITLHI